MKWGTKWDHNASGAHSFWGVLLNEISQTATFTDGATGGTTAPCDTDYVIIPAFGISIHTTLTWPYVSPSKTVALRNPKFGNTYGMDTESIVRRNKAMQLLSFRYPNWPTFETLKFKIEKLSPTDKDNVIDFIKASAGTNIGLLDYFDRQWVGLLISPMIDIIKQGKDDCTYEVSFEFLGKLA